MQRQQQQQQKVGHWVRKTQAKHAHIFAAAKYFKKGREKSKNNTHTYIYTYAHTYIYTYIAQNTVVNGAGDRKEIMCIYVVAY